MEGKKMKGTDDSIRIKIKKIKAFLKKIQSLHEKLLEADLLVSLISILLLLF